MLWRNFKTANLLFLPKLKREKLQLHTTGMILTRRKKRRKRKLPLKMMTPFQRVYQN